MKLAICYDYGFPTDPTREGIGVYCKFLFNSLMDFKKDLKIEFYCYSFNIENCKLLCPDVIKKYPQRISFICEKTNNNALSLKQKLKIFGYKLKYFFTKKQKYLDKINKILNSNPKDLEKSLQELAELSNADAVYVMHPNLKLGKYFKCKKIVQIHDLFPISLRDKFLELDPNIDEANSIMSKNLMEYAKQNTKFVSSSNYIAQNHSLKYIDGVKQEQLVVIPYPPMLKEFSTDNILSEKEFRKKFNIDGNYIPYPSQNRPNKNLIVLLKALKILKDKNIQIKLVTTGSVATLKSTFDYVKNNDLQSLIIEIGSISQEDLFALYKYSSLVVIPTIIEGPGMPQQALEPLKIGNIPVVCSKCLGVKESLESVGLSFETADLNWFDYDDYKTLAHNIEKVLQNPKENIKKQKHIISHYTRITWADVAKKYLGII